MMIVRYADDVVAGFEQEDDARRFLDAMRTRFEEFALSLHPDKTRLIEFGRHAAARRERRELGKPETFNFLGFTFICGKSRNGGFLLQRRSRGDRMRAKLQEIQEELRRRRHLRAIRTYGSVRGRSAMGVPCTLPLARRVMISRRAARKAVSLMRRFGQRTCAVDLAPLFQAPLFRPNGIQGRGLPLIPRTRLLDAELCRVHPQGR